MVGHDVHFATRLSAEERLAMRQQAEARFDSQPAVSATEQEALLPRAVQRLLQDLHLHQIELETQNEELRAIQAERDAAQARYFDFYDLAPVGYITISEQGLILHSNLAAAAMLAAARSQLALQPLSSFIAQEDQDTFYLLRNKLSESSSSQSCELRMSRSDGSHFFVRVDAIAARGDDGARVLRLVLIDITAQKRAEEEIRIAAVAFESQEAIVVMDGQRQILRVNRAFTEISGYHAQELLGKNIKLLYSRRHPESFYEDIWRETDDEGWERGERWIQHKNGDNLFAQGGTTALKDQQGKTTHYVITFSDQTLKHQQNQQRVQHEAAHREALVREVHHRIKNNLQGIGGLLEMFASQKPEIADQMQLVSGHLKGISVIHGLQGRHGTSRVRLCELTREIAQATSLIWQTDIAVEIPSNWVFRVVAEKDAVSMALVLNELLVNAVKHGGKAHGHVSVTLRQGQGIEGVELSILNAGYLRNNKDRSTAHHHGQQLIESLRPRVGLSVTLAQRGDQVLTSLQLTAPVIDLDTEH